MAREKACIVALFYPAVGGMTTLVRQLIKALSGKYEVLILSVKPMEEEGSEVYHYNIALNSKLNVLFSSGHLPTTMLYELSGAFWCFALSLVGVEIFLVQDAVLSGFLAVIVGKLMGRQVYLFDYGPVLNIHNSHYVRTLRSKYSGGLLTTLYVKLLRIMSKISLRYCRKFFVYSHEMKKHALNCGLVKEKIVFYTFPIDMNIFYSYNSHQKKKIREKFGIKKNEKVVTYIGRISSDKGLPHLLESARVLSRKYVEGIRFIIAGDGPLLEWLFQNVVGELRDHVLYLGPLRKPQEVADVLNASDIFVYPITISAGYAMSVLEAMATGLPSIITDVGPSKDLVTNNYNGIVVPANDSEALSDALERLIVNEKLRKSIGENAKKIVHNFSFETYRKTILDNVE